MKLALGQINPTVGDLAANVDRMIEFCRRASPEADVALFPELSVSGYPPRDLVDLAGYVPRNREQLERLARETANLSVDVVCGYVGQSSEGRPTNSAAYLAGGEVRFEQQKTLLPTYDVFDEWRHFAPAASQHVFEVRGHKIGLTVCEDVWNDKQFWKRPLYGRDPVEELVGLGCDLILNLSASPYHRYKPNLRLEMIRAAARRHRTPIVMVNQVGGNDHLVFDGSSLVVDAAGVLRARAMSFTEDLVFYDVESNQGELHDAGLRGDEWPAEGDPAEDYAVYNALVLGVRDYCRKCGFGKAIVGLSGGIDSSLTVAVAVDALGAENVMGVAMPGPYSSEGSVTDARHTAKQLGIRFEIVEIKDVYDAFIAKLTPLFAGLPPNVAEENLQARLRGDVLMTLSNKFGGIVLTTGNKSEVAVGYCTLYGDMCGGLAVIADVHKTLVYRLSELANERWPDAIPKSVLTKPPSAELRPDQKDEDSLPPYSTLDPILELYVEEGRPPGEIAETLGVDFELVLDVARKVERNEYKRQQMAPGLRVTSKAFGMGRRLPIAQKYER